jgi:hypothetical protein
VPKHKIHNSAKCDCNRGSHNKKSNQVAAVNAGNRFVEIIHHITPQTTAATAIQNAATMQSIARHAIAA